ncbi:hypothetical protein RJZ90_000659 [Blastomyces dermatitidis]
MAAVQESPERGRVLSFTGSSSSKSEKTHKSSGSHHKMNLSETHEEKEASRLRTHADPSRAIQELQPSAVALQKSNLESLRSVQHKDIYGNPITDPDLSNPTRHRFERPLDTIRSFEAAIDGSYMNRRASYARPDESTNGGYSRRSSYFGELTPRNALDRGGGGAAAGGLSNHRNGGYNEQANYSAHRLAPSRPDSYAESYGGGNYNGNNNNNNNNNNNGYAPRPPRHGGRMNQDQYMQGYNNSNNSNNYFSQQQHQQQQYPQNDNYNYAPASGSGSDVLAADADPNHPGDDVNSHPYRHHQQQNQQQTPTETYGFTGFSDAPDLDYPQHSPHSGGGGGYNHQNSTTGTDGNYADPSSNINNNNNNYNNNNGSGNQAPPMARKPVAAFSSPSPAPTPPVEKRKSFFKRFSKS